MKTFVLVLGILMVTGISMDLIAKEKAVTAEPEMAVAPDTASNEKEEANDTYKPVKWAPAVKPKELSNNVLKGLKWLLDSQHSDGGWSQGEESRHMGTSMDNLKDKPNVADTCAAALALIRSGSTPSKGEYARNITKAVTFVCDQIKKSDEKSLFITDLRNTRLQSKLGTYIDTFMASMLLAEVTGKMPDEETEEMVADAFEKVMDKIERNQRADGSFGGTGWANSLSQSMAAKGVNRAVQAGQPVSETVRAGFENNAEAQYDKDSGSFRKGKSAGVDLYASAATLSTMQDSDNTNNAKIDEVQRKIRNAKSPEDKEKAEQTLKRFKDNKRNLRQVRESIVKKLDEKQFISGFGTNGGEEFLSYMNIGESLVVQGGAEWEKWDKEITANLNRIQNKDGSWTGHHCITGRTFCTSAALLVLMTDRAPVPVAAKMKRR